MSEEKDKQHFQRQANRFVKSATRQSVNVEGETRTNLFESATREKSVEIKETFNRVGLLFQEKSEKTPLNYSSAAQEWLKRWGSTDKDSFQGLLKYKSLRQQGKKEERRLIKIRTDNKQTDESDGELSLLALNNVLAVAEDIIGGFLKEKEVKGIENKVRANQINEMTKQLAAIDEQIGASNFVGVKVGIQGLLKRWGKDEFLQERIGYLAYIQALTEEYERESAMLREASGYLERLSSVDTEVVNASVLTLKNLKKDLVVALNKENKKQEPNARLVAVVSQADKLNGLLLGFIEPKIEKKFGDSRYKKQEEVKGSETDQAARYCRELFDKEGRQQLYKQLDLLKRNKKKSLQPPYSLILRVYDQVLGQRKEATEFNLYLKGLGVIYQRKNVVGQALLAQLKKCDERYANNELIGSSKANLQACILAVQQRERAGKESVGFETDVKKLKKENERLEKLVEQLKGRGVQVQKVDKKKEIQQKRVKEAERVKLEKEEKDVEKAFEGIYANLFQKKWKPCKNAINVFLKRYEQSSNPFVGKSLQSMSAILSLVQQLETAEIQVSDYERKEKAALTAKDKDREALQQKLRVSEEYENSVKELLQNYQLKDYAFKKYFDDLRKDRKKVVQDRYLLIAKLEEPLGVWRTGKVGEGQSQNKTISLNYSVISEEELAKLQSEREQLEQLLEKQKSKVGELDKRLKTAEAKSNQGNKDAEELLNITRRMQKGGQWWKTIPANLKSSSPFKAIYALFEKNRESELQLQKCQVNESLFRQEEKHVGNAFNEAANLIRNTEFWMQPQFWQEQLAPFSGPPTCDKLIACLTLMTERANQRIAEERRATTHSIESEGLNLTGSVADIVSRDRGRDFSSSHIEESSSKKSSQGKSSRRNSKSRERESAGKLRQAMQQYIRDQRNLLTKIGQMQQQRQDLELIIKNIQRSLEQSQRRREQERTEADDVRFALEKLRIQQTERINELQGEIEISEGRRSELEVRYETDLGYYRDMHGELSQKLAEAKEKEGLLLREKESFKSENGVLSKKFEEDLRAIEHEMKDEMDVLREELERYKVSSQTAIEHTVTESSANDRSGQLEEIVGKLQNENRQLISKGQNLEMAIVQLQNQIANVKSESSGQYEALGSNYEVLMRGLKSNLQEEKQRYEGIIGKLQEENWNLKMGSEHQRLQKETMISNLSAQIIELQAAIEEERQKCLKLTQQLSAEAQKQKSQQIEKLSVLIYEQRHQRESAHELALQRQRWSLQTQAQCNKTAKQIQAYWLEVILPQKEREWQERIKAQRESIALAIPKHIQEIELTELQVMQLVKDPKYSHIIDSMTEQRKLRWEERKEAEFKGRQQQLYAHWQSVGIPDLKLNWYSERDAQLQKQPVSAVSHDKAIEEWKAQNLPAIIQGQRGFAVRSFMESELPLILEQQYQTWQATVQQATPIVDIQQILQRQRELWEREFREHQLPRIITSVQEEWDMKNQRHSELTVKGNANPEADVLKRQIHEMQRAFDHQRKTWLQQRQAEFKQWQNERYFHKQQLQRIRHQQTQQPPLQTQQGSDLKEWQRKKEEEWAVKTKEIESYWQNVVFAEREQQWRAQQIAQVDRVLTERLMAQEMEFNNTIIPAILTQEHAAWQASLGQFMEVQRQNWFNELPEMLKDPGFRHLIDPHLQIQAGEYDAVLKQVYNDRMQAELRIAQLQRQMASIESSKVLVAQREDRKLRDAKVLSHNQSGQAEDLRKVIGRQQEEINGLSDLARQYHSLKQEHFAQRQAFLVFQNTKMREIEEVRVHLEGQLIQMANQNNLLLARLAEAEGQRKDVDKEAFFMLQRQVETLSAALRAKDTEISFVKKTNDSLSHQVSQLQSRLSSKSQTGGSEHVLSSNLQLSYQNKYLKEREQSLVKKVEMNEQQLTSLRRKFEQQTELLEKKVRKNLEGVSSLQIRHNELESQLSIKVKEYMAASNEVDRLRFDCQKMQADCRLLTVENDSLRRQIAERDSQFTLLLAEKDRNEDVVRRLKSQQVPNLQREQQRQARYREQLRDRDTLIQSQDNEKNSLRREVEKLTEEISRLWQQTDEREKNWRRQCDRLQGELYRLQEQRAREVDPNELEVLANINREVSELTNAKRQLQLKVVLIENRERISAFDRELINFFLLVQRHSDALVDHLVVEGVVPNQQIYIEFLNKSRFCLQNGRVEEYFSLWQQTLRGLFAISIESRTEEIRVQSQQLLQLRDQMNEVLDRQIEMSQSSGQTDLQRYREVLGDVSAILQQYRRTGNAQHLQTLYRTLSLQ